MQKIKLYQLDAFSDKVFSGNPAAVCLMDKWPERNIMQDIAAENNLSETAFVIQKNNKYEIRWFTPAVEVDLCGHATLAASFVLFNETGNPDNEISFQTQKMGVLKTFRREEMYFLNFPSDTPTPYPDIEEISQCLHLRPLEVFKGRSDIMAVLKSENEVRDLVPDLSKISLLKARGLMVTAQATQADFVSRFFAPQSGIIEDPVTGSAHTTLIPYWAKVLNKNNLFASQLSKRGGALQCVFSGDRCLIGGNVTLYLKGEIYV